MKMRKSQKREETDEVLATMAKKICDAADRIGKEERLDTEARKKISESKGANEQASAFKNMMTLEKNLVEALKQYPEESDKQRALEGVREKMRGVF